MSSLGITYLHGARTILRTLIVGTNIDSSNGSGPPRIAVCDLPQASFLIGAVAFWEALVSFHVDQGVEAVDYLWPLCDSLELEDQPPNPWTGVNTKLFILVAKVGIITRQRRLLSMESVSSYSLAANKNIQGDLLNVATNLQQELQTLEIRAADHSPDTHDHDTPLSHFERMARVFQLAMLLELYQVFPELLLRANDTASANSTLELEPFWRARYFRQITTLAIQTLTIFFSIPPTSGTKAVQLLPLVIVGSALQYYEDPSDIDIPSDPRSLELAFDALLSSESDILRWRVRVTQALTTIYRHVELDSAHHGMKVVEEAWKRADLRATCNMAPGNARDGLLVHWASVMYDEGLETLLG